MNLNCKPLYRPETTAARASKGIYLYAHPAKASHASPIADCCTVIRRLCALRNGSSLDMQTLIGLMSQFSELLMRLADGSIAIDSNPAICSSGVASK